VTELLVFTLFSQYISVTLLSPEVEFKAITQPCTWNYFVQSPSIPYADHEMAETCSHNVHTQDTK